MMSRNHILLGLALLVTLILTWQTAHDAGDAQVVLPARVLAESGRAPNELSNLASGDFVLQQRPLVAMQADLFALPARPLAPLRTAPRKAQVAAAPLLPFRYLGRWQVGDTQVLSLDLRGEVLTAQVGDTLAGQYKLLAIDEQPPTGLQAKFLYLPLNQVQVMQIGATP